MTLARFPRAAVVAAYPRAAVADALLVVQKSRGWVSDEGVRDVAHALGLSAEEVDGVATFNNVSLAKTGTGYTLTASDGSLAGAWPSRVTPTDPAITAAIEKSLGA